MPALRTLSLRTALAAVSLSAADLLVLAPLTLPAQSKTAKPAAAAAMPALVGAWSGTATIPLPDSAIVVPVFYTFTQNGPVVAGTAMVPGQGSGPISNVVRTGKQIKFRVTAPEGKLLEHDGVFAADGSIEGMVNLDKQPIAKFKITQKPVNKAGVKPTLKGVAQKPGA